MSFYTSEDEERCLSRYWRLYRVESKRTGCSLLDTLTLLKRVGDLHALLDVLFHGLVNFKPELAYTVSPLPLRFIPSFNSVRDVRILAPAEKTKFFYVVIDYDSIHGGSRIGWFVEPARGFYRFEPLTSVEIEGILKRSES